MRECSTLRIGEFAQIGQVSIATLRHYDQYGLLKPSALDPNTGYRYYSLDQLPRLHRIVAFKDLGFPLEQIAQLLEENLSLDQQGVQHTQPHLLLRYSRYELHDDGMYADVELAVPLRVSLPGNELVSVRTLPGGLIACTVISSRHYYTERFYGGRNACNYTTTYRGADSF
jgi:DNA-binding transcriptional MerR regulator